MLINNRRNWGGGLKKLSVLSVKFFCKPKTDLKNSLLGFFFNAEETCWHGAAGGANSVLMRGKPGWKRSPQRKAIKSQYTREKNSVQMTSNELLDSARPAAHWSYHS